MSNSDSNQKEHHHTAETLNLIMLATSNLKDLNQMVESKKPCTDVVGRLTSVIQILVRCRGIIVGDHINSCVSTALSPGQEGVLKEVNQLLQHLANNPPEGSHH